MTRSVLLTELRRGATPVMAALSLLAGLLALYDLTGWWSAWPGRWMPFAAGVRMSLFMVGAVVVAVAAWQGGRERRRRMDEQLTSAARPRWQQVGLTWVALTLGAVAGMGVVIGAGVAIVVPLATYAGGGWWWVLLVTFPALAALSAVGLALGRLIPFRLVAPVAAVTVYALMVGVLDGPALNGVRWLFPVLHQDDGHGQRLDGGVSALQAAWFIAVAATALVVIGARRRWLAAVPAVAGVGAAVALMVSPPEWRSDPDALAPVCTDDGPQVCLARVNAYLLGDLAGPAQEALARWEQVPGGPERAMDDLREMQGSSGAAENTVRISVPGNAASLSGRLTTDRPVADFLHWWPTMACDDASYDDFLGFVEVAVAWGNGVPSWLSDSDRARYDRLLAAPHDDQVDWVGAVLRAAETCDASLLPTFQE